MGDNGLCTLLTAVADVERGSIRRLGRDPEMRTSGWLWATTGVVLLTGVHTLLQLATPFYSVQVMDRFVPTGDVTTLLKLVCIISMVLLADTILELSRISIITKIATALTSDTMVKLLRGRNSVKDSVSLLQEMTSLRSMLSGSLGLGLLDLPASMLFTAVLFWVHHLLGISCLILMTATVIVGCMNGSAVATKRRRAALQYQSLDIGERKQSATALLTGVSRERFLVTALRIVCGSGVIAEVNGRASILNQTIRLIGQVGMITITGLLIARREIGLDSMIVSTLLFGRAISTIERCSDLPSIKEFYKILCRIKQEAESMEEVDADRSTKVLPLGNAISLCSVAVRYTPTDRFVLTDVGFEAAPGEITILLGDTAAGKSTLLSVLACELELSAGTIKMAGFNLHDMSREELQERISYLPQRFSFGTGSLADIIAGDRRFDADRVVEAAEMAGIHQLVLSMPGGYKRIWHSSELPWSRGQLQLLALARVFYGRSAVLLLDEPFSFLGELAEEHIIDGLKSLRKEGANIIIVSRSPRLSRIVDQSIYINEGKVAGSFKRKEIEEHFRAACHVDA